jgi:tight adherence protein C
MLLLADINAIGLTACLAIGGGVSLLLWWIFAAMSTEDLTQEGEWRYDVSRINELRRVDPLYRLFQPVIRFLAKLCRAAFQNQLPEVHREIQAAGLPRYWLPEEYLAKMVLITLLLFPLYVFVCVRMFGFNAIVPAVMFTAVTLWVLRRRLTGAARKRLVAIKRRMPFLLDLLTLLMEAGASFLQSLKQAVSEFEGHPVATEFGRVLTDMNMGKARTEAFDNMRQRLNDDEISAIVGSILQSEELGTPLTHIFRTQADVLQVKRTQRAETIANEAGVNMLLPSMLVMAATVLIILGPFLLNYLFFDVGM